MVNSVFRPLSRRGLALPRRLALLAAIVPLVAACAPTSNSQTSPTSAPAAIATRAPAAAASPAVAGATAVTVTMTNDMKYEPASITVPKGATVTWRNTSTVDHTVTDDPSKAVTKSDAGLPSGVAPWDSGNVAPGQTYQHTFDTPGTYHYFCIPHEAAGMVGTITVTG